MTQLPVRIGVIQFPGSNCERETALALKRAGCEPVDFLWSEPKEKLEMLDGYVIAGGFSYEDRIRSGLIASKDPVMQAIKMQAKDGKPVLGICNGAQILVESGLVPGLAQYEVAIALAENQRMRDQKLIGVGFYNDWVYIKTETAQADSAFSTPALAERPIYLPVAHAEGRFLLDPDLYQSLQKAGAVFYYYCNEQGEVLPEFPVNPNGSMYNLAAIGNAAGNVLAMMPHPERTPAGDTLFIAMRQFIEKRRNGMSFKSIPFSFPAPRFAFSAYSPMVKPHLDYWVGLKIQDNEALTLQNTLTELGVRVALRKLIHWQMTWPHQPVDSQTIDHILRNHDELFNRQKEYLCDPQQWEKACAEAYVTRTYIIRAHEDERALAKAQQLKHVLDGPFNLLRETVWQVTYLKTDEAAVRKLLEHGAILGNPLAHEGYIL